MSTGSGSTYVYGYCDATYQEGWGKEETIEFVKNSTSQKCFPQIHTLNTAFRLALALAMSRDGSSGGVIRMAVITEDGVERLFVPGDKLPTFWQGREVLGQPIKSVDTVAPMVVEA
jgi:20S proteasome subunit beta 1